MRKWLLALVIVFVIAFVAFAYSLPEEVIFKKRVLVSANHNSVYRALTDENLIQKWFPGKKVEGGKNIFSDGNYSYQFMRMVETVKITISDKKGKIECFTMIFPLKKDSTAIEWIMPSKKAHNIFSRVSNYFFSGKNNGEVNHLIERFTGFASNEESIYGFTVVPAMVKDTMLITTATQMDHFPNTEEYYSMIEALKTYAAGKGATETNYPMLNIHPEQKNHYAVRVAIPINKIIPDAMPIQFKRMVPGKIVTVEIKGGINTVMSVMEQMDTYIFEHQYTSPAIPFQSLVTNREQEQDTSNWITKIYYPIL